MKHLHRDLDLLRSRLLDLGRRVELAVSRAAGALFERNADVALEVVESERDIDLLEVQLEEECLKILALHQPVAGDLRFVVTALKVDNDLERMGDAAESIAARALQLCERPAVVIPMEFPRMSAAARAMTQKALECLVRADVAMAREVLADDDVVDAEHRAIFTVLQEQMRANPDQIEQCVLLLSVSRHLERIADLATNIAEDVIFLHDGEIVRHKRLS